MKDPNWKFIIFAYTATLISSVYNFIIFLRLIGGRYSYDSNEHKWRNILEVVTCIKTENLPEDVTFPDSFRNKIDYDTNRMFLIFKGVMAEKDRKVLVDLRPEASYKRAIEELFQKSQIEYFQQSWNS